MKLKNRIDLPVVLIPRLIIVLACSFLIANFESARTYE